MLKANVTQLTTFDLYLRSDWFDTQKLIDDLTTPFEGNELTTFGTNFHNYLENPNFDTNYSSQIIAEAFNYRLKHRNLISEIPTFKIYKDFKVTARIDGIDGIVIHEHKTSNKDRLDSYIESAQWRFYLDIMASDQFQYNMWIFDKIPNAQKVELLTLKLNKPKDNLIYLESLIDQFKIFLKTYNLESKFTI